MNDMQSMIKQIFSEEGFEYRYYLSGTYGEGEYISYHDNGSISCHCYFKNKEKYGESKRWYKNGQLEEHCFHKNNGYEGEYKEWWDDKELRSHKFYKDGERVELPDNIKKGYILVDDKYYPDIGDIQ